MRLQTLLAEIRRHWKTFVAVSGVVFAATLGWHLLTPATYVSNTQLLVSVSGSTTAAAYQNDQVVAGRINSYIALLTTDVVSQRVVDKLKLPMTASELATKVSATNVPPRTSLMDVAVTDTSPERARLLANTLANEFISYTDALETPTGEDGQKVHTTVVSAATEARERRAERLALAALGAVAALLLGSVAVWVRWRIDPVVRTAEEAAAAAGVPIIATVTTDSTLTRDGLEEYDRLGTHLRSTSPSTDDADKRGHVWALTSAQGEVDIAQISWNLGRALALAGGRAVVLDSGTTRPLRDGEPLPDAVEDDSAESAGSDANTARASSTPSTRQGEDDFPGNLSMQSWPDRREAADGLLDELRDDYTDVIVAAPPLLSSDGVSIIGESADAIVLVLSLGTTKRKDLEQSASNLAASDSPLALVISTADHRVPAEAEATSAVDYSPSSAPTEGMSS